MSFNHSKSKQRSIILHGQGSVAPGPRPNSGKLALDKSPKSGLRDFRSRKSLAQRLRFWLVQRLERRFDQWLSNLAKQGPLPLKLVIWTGREWVLGGQNPHTVCIKIASPAALAYLMQPSLSNLGEAYVEGLIDVEGALPDIVNMAHCLAERNLRPEGVFGRVAHRYTHAKRDDKAAIEHHYDVSNDFYRLWLDPEMVYSCAYFEQGSETLAEAQLKKLDHILVKVQVQPTDRLLDIGCGWGALVIRAAQNFGCRCVGITLSEQQYAYAKARVQALGLSDRIEIRLQDYRDVRGEFERITSVGMFEHVGVKNLPAYFRRLQTLLTRDGLALNHGITSTDPNDGQTAYGGGDFIAKYVFPGGELAHLGTVLSAMQRGGLEVLDVEGWRRHYAKTLVHWAECFEANTEKVREMVGDKKYRIWRVYLLGCAQAFERDEISLFQVLCTRAGSAPNRQSWSRSYMYRGRDLGHGG
jgi:cyclopropane-fatty-acyl-phospholipid synthase